jgi:hypothetical protein
MSAAAVLPAMRTAATCVHTGLSIPECCCRACHLEQLRRHAPALVNHRPPTIDLRAPIVPLELYAQALGVSVAQLRREGQKREVEL